VVQFRNLTWSKYEKWIHSLIYEFILYLFIHLPVHGSIHCYKLRGWSHLKPQKYLFLQMRSEIKQQSICIFARFICFQITSIST
jgi:hypothetical protein